AAVLVLVRARYSADLSAFLPRTPSNSQQLLVDQLRDGLASRLDLIGIEGGDASERAAASLALARALRASGAFVSVSDGAAQDAARDRDFLFAHRYVLSDAVNAAHFSTDGLRAAIGADVELLSSPAGVLAQSLLRSDPTGETLQVLDTLSGAGAPHHEQGVWSSPDGRRALLIAATRASGSDTDAQARALGIIRTAFAASSTATAAPLQLLLAGAPLFAVQARATIEREAVRLSLLSGTLIVTLLLLVYRSVSTLLLGLLPVVSGALSGVAVVALGFGVVHGVTLGFGVTLIGESVDYSVYLLLQSRPGTAPPGKWGTRMVPAQLWPTMGLGVLTSVCGFASLLPSAFPGLAQLGLYSISGLLAAALATRLVLPALLPAKLRLRDLAPFGAAATRALGRLRTPPLAMACLALVCAGVLTVHRHRLWNLDLAALSPVSPQAQALDTQLRGELGAPDPGNLVAVLAPDQQRLLERAEQVGRQLDALVAAGVIAGYDSPARYLPSAATQAARRTSLPDAPTLRARLDAATANLPVRASALGEFVQAVDSAHQAPPLERGALEGTSFALALDAMLWQDGAQWRALLPLRASADPGAAGSIDVGRVRAALAGYPPGAVVVLNVRQETDTLYGSYLREAIRLSLLGFAAIVLLLLLALRSPRRVARVIAPLLLAVLCVAAMLVAAGTALSILHLIGLLLIVAVGSNYALFFDRSAADADRAQLPRTLASLLVANASTVIGFGVLAGSSVPVLHALGSTVAPGTALALLFAALLYPRALLQAAPGTRP
ncbi:MAG TPA: MMPL family transporter, partial [Steroidobacteraceae bacterium]|nr:MMPL family transporter [Steroidobacteraceae bacterium]